LVEETMTCCMSLTNLITSRSIKYITPHHERDLNSQL
jgi:hypothetical protein